VAIRDEIRGGAFSVYLLIRVLVACHI